MAERLLCMGSWCRISISALDSRLSPRPVVEAEHGGSHMEFPHGLADGDGDKDDGLDSFVDLKTGRSMFSFL